jgi:hypothetical protein
MVQEAGREHGVERGNDRANRIDPPADGGGCNLVPRHR